MRRRHETDAWAALAEVGETARSALPSGTRMVSLLLCLVYVSIAGGGLYSLLESAPASGVRIDWQTGRTLPERIMQMRMYSQYSHEGLIISALIALAGVSLHCLHGRAGEKATTQSLVTGLAGAALALVLYCAVAEVKTSPAGTLQWLSLDSLWSALTSE